MQTAFRIDIHDNVATALCGITPGEVAIRGDTDRATVIALTDVPKGHKIALCDLRRGDPVVKYGVVIGSMTADVPEGSWVHLHVMRSNYDERSEHLDPVTGAPLDMKYE